MKSKLARGKKNERSVVFLLVHAGFHAIWFRFGIV